MKSRIKPGFFAKADEQPPRAQENNLHTTGYQIIRQAVPVDARVLAFAEKSSARNSKSIFNHNETNARNDHKRRQCNLLVKSKYMQEFDSRVQKLVKDRVNTALKPTNPVILHSRPGCQPQAAHCDYVPDDSLKTVDDKAMPLAVLIALMPNTRLTVWPDSCRLATKDTEQLASVEPIHSQELELNAGDMVIFRGDFIHAGSSYAEDNFRIHYFLDSPFVPRTNNRTWLIEQHGCDELQRIIRTHSHEYEPAVKRSKVGE